MVDITKQEKFEILKQYPNVCIVRTEKQKSKRHHYHMEEARGPMNLLHRLRGEPVQDNEKKKRPYWKQNKN